MLKCTFLAVLEMSTVRPYESPMQQLPWVNLFACQLEVAAELLYRSIDVDEHCAKCEVFSSAGAWSWYVWRRL